MWRWAISCAAFINNISATYYSKEKVWAVPYELLHGEPFPDVSIVVPFGCAALFLLEKDDRKKFHSTCSMVIFIHYAQDHPLYTYAFFSPRTKMVIFRQDCIFLPEIFPMRETQVKIGLLPKGENLMVYKPRPIYGKSRMGSDKWYFARGRRKTRRMAIILASTPIVWSNTKCSSIKALGSVQCRRWCGGQFDTRGGKDVWGFCQSNW